MLLTGIFAELITGYAVKIGTGNQGILLYQPF
jgi:hypothetical protein